MKKVDQTRFGSKRGNCLPACIASILEINPTTIPNFCEIVTKDQNWQELANDWLKPFNMGMVTVDVSKVDLTKDPILPKECYCIATGPSPRGDFFHSVVAKGGEIVHDPHPSRDGLPSITELSVFVVLDPVSVVFLSAEESLEKY